MSYKLKHNSIPGFCEKLASALCDDFYAGKEKMMDGGALTKLTGSGQVNAFLIQALFRKWQLEMEKLESPYFNFRHQAVKDALKDFMNVLSQHISIEREYIEPLLYRAIGDTIWITFEPVKYLEQALDEAGSLSDVRHSLKYIKTHKASFEQLFREKDALASEAALLEKAGTIFAASGDDIDLRELTGAFGTDLGLLFEQEKTEESPAGEASETEGSDTETLNDRFNGTSKGPTLADKLKKNMHQSMESRLTLNEKFMFVNALFAGDQQKMSKTLAEIDTASGWEEARAVAEKHSANWDTESEAAEAFFEILERHFDR